MHVNHYIITRVNLGMYSSEKVVKVLNDSIKGSRGPLALSSLENRNSFMLSNTIYHLKRASIPSILYQTNKNFKWIWLVDKGTPDGIKAQLTSLAQLCNAYIIFDEWKSDQFFSERNSCGGNWLEQFKLMFSRKERVIACTRYDIDDFLSSNFVEVVQSHFDALGCVDFEFRISVCKDNSLYMIKNLSNGRPSPIVTLLEERNNLKTPYYTSHYRLSKLYLFRYFPDVVYAKVERGVNEISIVSKMEEKKLQDIESFKDLKEII